MDRSPDGNPEHDLYYIGNLYTKLSHRGIGLGLELFKRALAMIDFYDKRFGFVYYPEYFNAYAKMKPTSLLLDSNLISTAKIQGVNSIDFTAVIIYDQSICTRQRTKYLKKWLAGEYATSKVAVDDEGNVIGFICVRPQIANRVTVGPFYANNEEVAHDLFLECLKEVPNLKCFDELWIRFPEPNEQAIHKLTNGDYKITRSVKSMFTKQLIEPDPKRIFSVFESAHSLI